MVLEEARFLGLTLLAFDAVRNAVWLALFSLVVLPRLLDALRAPAVEPKRLEPLARACDARARGRRHARGRVRAGVVVSAELPRGGGGRGQAAAAGAHGRVFANERYADWLVFEHPQLAGRIAYDSRFELLTSRQLRTVQEFRNLVAGWRGAVRGYPALVLDRYDDAKPIAALVRTKATRAVTRRGPIVVLRQR